MNRHERISHLYRDHRRYNADAIAQSLAFQTTREALVWLVGEFCSKTLDWHILRAGSPYPIGLPNFVRLMEESVGTTLEALIHDHWSDLTEESRQAVDMNFERIFGQPELKQGSNAKYCALKFARWLVTVQDGNRGLEASDEEVDARAAEIIASRPRQGL